MISHIASHEVKHRQGERALLLRRRTGAVINGAKHVRCHTPCYWVIDYRTGNSRSVARALSEIGVPHRLLKAPDELDGVDRIILPGVGAAGTTMEYLEQAGWPAVLRSLIADGGMPFLGICVGLQVLFEHSEEQDADCLGWLPGTVRLFGKGLRVPQIGWNQGEPPGTDGADGPQLQ
jgi:imidazole glycerol phosphate synthase glutamine amidotransferase subunit